MDILTLAARQLEREGLLGKDNAWELLLDRAVVIRRWLDMQHRNRKVARNRWKHEVV